MTRLPIALDVFEIHRRQPVQTDVDVLRRFGSTGQIQIASARRAAADEDRVVVLREQIAHRFDARVASEIDAEIEDVADLFVDHFFGQTETRHLRAHEPAAFLFGFENGDVIAERREITRDGQRRRPRAHAGDAFSVLVHRRFRHARFHGGVVFVVGGDALQSADRNRLGFARVVFLDAAASARGLARAIARAPENSGKHIRFPVDEISVRIMPGGDKSDVFRNRGVRGTGPLTIDDFMEVVGNTNIGRLHPVLRDADRRRARPFGMTPRPESTRGCLV